MNAEEKIRQLRLRRRIEDCKSDEPSEYPAHLLLIAYRDGSLTWREFNRTPKRAPEFWIKQPDYHAKWNLDWIFDVNDIEPILVANKISLNHNWTKWKWESNLEKAERLLNPE